MVVFQQPKNHVTYCTLIRRILDLIKQFPTSLEEWHWLGLEEWHWLGFFIVWVGWNKKQV